MPMVEGQFGLKILEKYVPPVRVILDEMKAFSEAHEEAVEGNPKTVSVNGDRVVIQDVGPTRIVTHK